MIARLDEQQMLAAQLEEVHSAVSSARHAQIDWAPRPTAERARLIGELRPLLAAEAMRLAEITASGGGRPVAEKLASEVLPLLDACRFLQKNATRILRAQRFGRSGRPLWLHGTSFEVHRRPYGVVLIVGPGNYPLFIPAVQMLHAIAAGNAVVIKPAPESTAPLSYFVDRVLARSGIPTDVVQLLPEQPQAARDAVRCGVDKAIFTGSSENGRDFLRELAQRNIPSVMELSGADAVIVREDADIEIVAKAIVFGTGLNGGNTCMAPRHLIVHMSAVRTLEEALEKRGLPNTRMLAVRHDADALALANADEHGLGAAIFSRDVDGAKKLAAQLRTGFATINDIIVPTADPRFPFGGVQASGFGVTRGAEGLLEMTYPQAVSVRRSRFLPHLDDARDGDAELFTAFMGFAHGRGFRRRLRSLRLAVNAGRARLRANRSSI